MPIARSPHSPTRRRIARGSGVLAVALAAALPVLGTAQASAADPERYQAYYDIFDRGGALIPGTDTKWVPQGLTYWAKQDALLISYYDSTEVENSRVAVIDRNTGAARKIVSLPEKGHVGGLGMSRGFLWVASDDGVSRYREANLARKASGSTLRRNGVPFRLAASSYMTTVGNKLWVGSFENDIAYRYKLDARAKPIYDAFSIRTPNETQGMVATRGKYILSSSYGRDNDSTISVLGGRSILAPNMSEGMTMAKGELRVVYESGSAFYADADYRVKTVHRAPIASVIGG